VGAESLFGPGLVDLSPNRNAAQLRLTRPAHVVVLAVRDGETAKLAAPRRSDTRLSRTGDHWVDLPWPLSSGPATTTFVVGAPGGRLPAAGRSRAAAAPGAVLTSSPGTVILVVVADSGWNREAINALLPREPQPNAMALAGAIATVLLGSRGDTSAAYLARW
jgi:hypothetical protein